MNMLRKNVLRYVSVLLVTLMMVFSMVVMAVNTVLNDPPTVEITNPKDGADVSGTVLIEASAFSDRGIKNVECMITFDGTELGTDFTAPYSWNWNTSGHGGMHTILVIADDGEPELGSDEITVNVIPPPLTTPTLAGPTSGTTGITYQFTVVAVDPDGGWIFYWVDWGEEYGNESFGLYDSGVPVNLSHTWYIEGTYTIKVKASHFVEGYQDESDWSEPLSITIVGNKNCPNKPSTPRGPTEGARFNSYTYESMTTDSDGDQLYYMFCWFDGTDSGWVGPYDSGDVCQMSHVWTHNGRYGVIVYAKDSTGAVSPNSDILMVSMRGFPSSLPRLYTGVLFSFEPYEFEITNIHAFIKFHLFKRTICIGNVKIEGILNGGGYGVAWSVPIGIHLIDVSRLPRSYTFGGNVTIEASYFCLNDPKWGGGGSYISGYGFFVKVT